MTKRLVIAATGINAFYVLSVQIIALLTLVPADFGAFSIQYLFFALAGSISLSVVCEPWLRRALHEGREASWHKYSSVLLYLSITAALITLVISLVIPILNSIAVPGCVAVFASTYRSGARYHDVRNNRWGRVLAADGCGLIVTISVWSFIEFSGNGGLLGVSVAWAAGAVVAAAVMRLPHLNSFRSIPEWFRIHRLEIPPLIRDSVLMDLGAIGTPFVVAPMLGITDFGIYRAVSNVAAPVRLVLNPLRPTVSSFPREVHSSRRVSLAVIGASVAFGSGAYLALLLVRGFDLELGSLTALVPFALPTAFFVGANFLGHYYYIVGRAHLRGSSLLFGRIVQTLLAVILPIGGALLGTVSIAIWGLAIATLISAVVWFVLVQKGLQQLRAL